jgi:hypothetical protein
MSSFDFRSPAKKEEDPIMAGADQHSPFWAGVARPFALIIFILVSIVIITPFITLPWIQGLQSTERATMIVDWGKAVLPSVVGFAAAVVGYYFGTRVDQKTEADK